MPAQEQAEEREEDAQIRRNAEKQIKDADKAP